MVYIYKFLLEILISTYCLAAFNIISLMRSSQSLVVFQITNVSAILLALIENKATVAYFLEYQLISLLLSIKINLDIDFQLFLLLT